MRLYLDTSLVVAALIHEAGTPTARAFLSEQHDQQLLISSWTCVELASALSIKHRSQVINANEHQRSLKRFQIWREQQLQVAEPNVTDYATAHQFCAQHTPPLRAGDALHLAICQRQRSCLVSFDRELCRAGKHYGVAIRLLQINAANS